MSALQYTVMAYVIAGGLVWGYGAHLFLAGRALARKQARSGGRS